MQGKVYDMFYGAPPVIHKQAKELRSRETKAEKLLWTFLLNHKLKVKFRRQHPISQFIVDFYCHQLKMVIEADGEIHNNKEHQDYDKMRDQHMQNLGLHVVRFSNAEILKESDFVINQIQKEIDQRKT